MKTTEDVDVATMRMKRTNEFTRDMRARQLAGESEKLINEQPQRMKPKHPATW